MKLDPQSEAILNAINQSGMLPFAGKDPAVIRAQNAEATNAFPVAKPEVFEVRDRVIPNDEVEVPIRVYWPGPVSQDKTYPAILFFHGGGFFMGDLESHDNVCRELCKRVEAIVVAVDYRLAPEHPFPAAVDDSYAALTWLAKNGGDLGVDTDRIAVVGDSAGGNLVAVICLLARDRKGPNIAFQIPVYPGVALDDAKSYPSRTALGGGDYFLAERDIEWMVDMYLPDDVDPNDYRAFPIRAKSFEGLPPALVITAGLDPLVDEGRAYSEALERAGVPTEYRCFPTTIHGFFSMVGLIDAAEEAMALAADRLRGALKVG